MADGPSFFDDPREYAEHVQKQYDMQSATADLTQHEAIRVISEMTAEQLDVIAKIFVAIRDCDSGATVGGTVANFWVGMARALLQERHGICMACHKNHAELLAEQPPQS